MSYVIDGTTSSQFFLAAQDLGLSPGDWIFAYVKKTGSATEFETPIVYATNYVSSEYFRARLFPNPTVQVTGEQQFGNSVSSSEGLTTDEWELILIEWRDSSSEVYNWSVDGLEGTGGFIGTAQTASNPYLSIGSDVNSSGNQNNAFLGKVSAFGIISDMGVSQAATILELLAFTYPANLTDATLREWWNGDSLTSEVNSYVLTQDANATIDLNDNPFSTGPAVTLDAANYQYGDTLTGTYTDFAGAITSGTATDSNGNEYTLSVTDNLDGTWSAPLPEFAGGLDALLFGTITVELTDGTDTADDTFTLDVPDTIDNWQNLTDTAGAPPWFTDLLTVPLAINDQLLSDNSRATIGADASITISNGDYYTQSFYVVSYDSGSVTQLDITFNESGEVVSGKLASKKLEVVKIFAVKLTSVKLGD